MTVSSILPVKGNTFKKHIKCLKIRRVGKFAHVFIPHLFLCELDFNEGLDCGKELPPGPVLHSTVLLDVFLNTPDC